MKHGVLVRVTCEVVSGYICTMKIHTAEGLEVGGHSFITF